MLRQGVGTKRESEHSPWVQIELLVGKVIPKATLRKGLQRDVRIQAQDKGGTQSQETYVPYQQLTAQVRER